jgi:hypothetical protein
LDSELGFFFGAHIAERACRKHKVTGCVSHVAVIISATTSKHRPNRASSRNLGVAHHVTACDKFNKDGKALGRRSIRITSTILGELVANTCGVLAQQEGTCKFFQAPELPQRARGRLLQRRWLWKDDVTAGSISSFGRYAVLLLTFGIRSRIVENLTAVAHAEKKGLKGSRCWVLNLGKCDSAIFAHLHQHHRLQTSCSRFTQDYCKTESYKDVIPDVILENRPPVNIKTQFAMKMLTTGHHSNGEAL